jgi:peptidoglycan/LPS O-acetylase OafA/YrhL
VKSNRSTTPTRSGPFPCFDGLRILAAMSVFAYHVLPAVGPSWYGDTIKDYVGRLGSFGVCVFFLISGFLLYRPFVTAHLAGRPHPKTLPFYRRRFLRIFPAYWLAITALFYVFAFKRVGDWTNFVTYYGLLQNYRAAYVLSGLGVAWTLVVEVSFYVSLPAIAWAIRVAATGANTVRERVRIQLLGVAALYGIALVIRGWRLVLFDEPAARVGSWFPLGQAGSWLIGSLDWFALGMLLAIGSAWVARGGRPPRVVELLADRPAMSWLFAAQLYWISVQMHLPDQYAVPTTSQAFGRFFFHGAAAFLLILPAVFGSQDRGRIRAFLKSRPIAWLGTISYGIYLWHSILLTEVQKLAHEGHIPTNAGVEISLIFISTVIISALSYYIVELPLIRFSHRGGSSESSNGKHSPKRDSPTAPPPRAHVSP